MYPINHLITIIVPNYCHAKYLDQRIQSILNQTYQHFELIILDDCSPDDGASKAVIEKYRSNPHVSHIVYNEQNSGSTFKQWEKGIGLAKGEYVWIAESDDFCELTLLDELVSQIKEHPSCSLAYALSQQVDDNGKFKGHVVKPLANRFLKGLDFIRRYMCCENPVYNASSAIFKKDAALRIDRQYMDYKGAGDRLFWIEIAEQGDVAVVNKPLNYFRQHGDKVTPQKTIDGTNMRENYRIFNYLCKKKLLSPFRQYLVRGYSAYLIDSTRFASEEIRSGLTTLWNVRDVSMLQKVFGRLFVSLHYHHLNLYL